MNLALDRVQWRSFGIFTPSDSLSWVFVGTRLAFIENVAKSADTI
jgi:hypothetical protein